MGGMKDVWGDIWGQSKNSDEFLTLTPSFHNAHTSDKCQNMIDFYVCALCDLTPIGG